MARSKSGAIEVQKVGRQTGAAPDTAARAAGPRQRSFAGGVRARHSHGAHRHSGARRIAGQLRSRRTRAALGFQHQRQRRASRRAHDIDDRAAKADAGALRLQAGGLPAAASDRSSRRFARRAGGGQGPQRRGDGRGRCAGALGRRRGPAAGGAGKSHRQCGEVHRARRRAARCARGARGARPRPAGVHRHRQRHRAQAPPRSSGCSVRSRKPTPRSRGATAAPGSGLPSSSIWPS